METRFERKWLLPFELYNELYFALKKSVFQFEEQFKVRNVNSIYFDDFYLNSVYQNLDGIADKQKLRLRWYNKEYLISNPALEIKKKVGFMVRKKTYKLNLEKNFVYDFDIFKLTTLLKKKFPLIASFNPISSTHYKRYYFISKDRNVRATIDTDVGYYQIKNFRKKNINKKKERKIILELKYNKNLDSEVRNKLNLNNSLRFSRNSKFINSIFDIY